MECELSETFNANMSRNLDNRDARLAEVLPISDREGHELLFRHFGHIDAAVLEDLQRVGKRWGSMRLLEVSGSSMRWRLLKKSKWKCSSACYNIVGLLLSYAVLAWSNPQRWMP